MYSKEGVEKEKTINEIIIFIILLVISAILIYYHRIKYLLFIASQYKTRELAILVLVMIVIIIVIYRRMC